MSQRQPRRLHFRGRKLTSHQLAAAQELTWAKQNCERAFNEAGNSRAPGSSELFHELLELYGDDEAVIEWNRRNQPI
jgi:hypothetical protein